MRRFVALLFLASCTLARPATNDEYLSVDGDATDVGSTHREVRAAAPQGFATEVHDLLFAGTSPKRARQANAEKNAKSTEKNSSGKSDEGGLYKQYGSDAEGEKGYEKQTYSKGDHGYKSLDTFHKQDGDNYEFERHTAFGKGQGGHESGKSGKSGSYKSDDGEGGDHEGAGTIVNTHYVEHEGDNAGYTEGGADGGESSHYEEGDEGGHHISGGEGGHYTSGGDGGHYTSGGDVGHHTSDAEGSLGSYTHGGESGEHYSAGSGGEGSHGSHGSYSTGSEGQGYDGGYEGGSYH